MLTTYSIQSESMYKLAIHITQDLVKNQVTGPITQEFHMILSRISEDIKWMPLSNQGFNYISFAACEISNYVTGIPTQKTNVVTFAEALLYRVL